MAYNPARLRTAKVTNLSSISSVVGPAVTVALIVIVTRWVVGAKGAQLPRIRAAANVYDIKWQWRAIGLAGCLFFTVIAMKLFPYNLAKAAGWMSLIAFPAMALLGLWMAIGMSVTTDEIGITQKRVWHSTSIPWNDITEIRLHKRDGGAIELRAGPQKLIIDVRFVARQHLLNEIIAHTQLKPIGTHLDL
jgi:hypothetical protein